MKRPRDERVRAGVLRQQPPARVLVLRVASVLAFALSGARAHLPAQAPGTTIVYTGTFIALDSSSTRVHAIAVRDGVIVAIGSLAHVDSVAGARAAHVALPGFVLPGFADAHAHPLDLGQQLESMDLHALSKAEVLRRVARAAQKAPAGAWIRGTGWDQAFWSPPIFPTAAELERVSAGHPVLLDRIDG
ncbi:MAG: amidohydrolase family protein, partial [Gemmatimonas sp.]